MDPEEIPKNETISWAAFHASQQPVSTAPESNVSINSLVLHLFYESAHSEAMIRHSMDVVKMAFDILHPKQVPIITMDQPLYAIAANESSSHGQRYKVKITLLRSSEGFILT